MKTLVMGAALAALLSAAPAIAKEKTGLKGKEPQQSSKMLDQENANRLQNDDGTFQGKPVVQGPADWSSSASSGASSGEAGSGSSGESGSGK